MLSLIFLTLMAYSSDCELALSNNTLNINTKNSPINNSLNNPLNKQFDGIQPIADYYSAEDEIEFESMLESLVSDTEHFFATDLGLSNIDSFEPYEDRPFVRDVFVIAQLKAAMLKILTPKEERVLRMSFFLNMDLDAAAKDLRVTRERIRQIELQALIKLKRYLDLKGKIKNL